MNIIQMLNTWRWFTKHSVQPLLDNETEYPTWFWGDRRSSGWSFVDTDNQLMKGPTDCYLFALDSENKFPSYFILDKTEVFLSRLMEDIKAEENYRNWLTKEENKNLHGIDLYE